VGSKTKIFLLKKKNTHTIHLRFKKLKNIELGDVARLNDHPKEELAKFGYRS
jgi:hypothetical protein